MRISINQRGDSIVEVLICLTIISLVLSIAFASSNRSLSTVRQAQERVEALKFIEGQVEKLKALTARSDGDPERVKVMTSTSLFCIADSPTPVRPIVKNAKNPTAPITPVVSLDTDNFNEYVSPDCKTTGGVPYNLSIERVKTGNIYTFTIRARWERVSGKGKEESSIGYRL